MRYVFTDKTGTLTRNIMEFRLCKIGHHIYGDETTPLRPSLSRENSSSAKSQLYEEEKHSKNHNSIDSSR